MFYNPPGISKALNEEFKDYARTKYPYEACAFIINDKLVPVKNIHNEPSKFFALSKKDSFLSTKAQGFLHSHIDGSLYPSEPDMRSQINAGIPFGICTITPTDVSNVLWWGDHLLDTPILERTYVPGVFDCWEVIRSVYHQDLGIKLLPVPRSENWWKLGQKPYDDNLIVAKGVEVDQIQPYDVVFMKLVSTFTDHAVVYLPNDKIVHHLRGRLSKEDSLIRYRKSIHKIIRYVD